MDMEICTPAKFYMFFAVLLFLTAMFYGQSSLFIIVQIIVSVAWVFGLNVLCQTGYMTIAWAITLIPIWISIILYGLTFIPLYGTGAGTTGGTFAPTPGDFTRLKSATVAEIINSIFRQFTSQVQISIKPVFDQARCNAAKALVPTGWGANSYATTDALGPYFTEGASGNACTGTTFPTSCTEGVYNTVYSSSTYGSAANAVAASADSAHAGWTHRPPQALWQAQVAACQGGAPTN